jgi:hypothetical protein
MSAPTAKRNSGWLRVHKTRSCPICGRPDWCLLSADGGAAICARVVSPKRCGEAGWLHRLRDEPFRPARPAPRHVPQGPRPSRELADLAAGYHAAAVAAGSLRYLARQLGVSEAALVALRAGWSSYHRSWSFPMCNAACEVIGVRLRRPNGYKFAVPGSHNGLFLSVGVEAAAGRRLHVVEGATDAAALIDLGFPGVVGRPSCTGGTRLLVELVRRRAPGDVVIVADADAPGLEGAGRLAQVLVGYTPTVRVVAPPEGTKDVRAWLLAGAVRADLEQAIAAATARRMTVTSRTRGARRAGR